MQCGNIIILLPYSSINGLITASCMPSPNGQRTVLLNVECQVVVTNYLFTMCLLNNSSLFSLCLKDLQRGWFSPEKRGDVSCWLHSIMIHLGHTFPNLFRSSFIANFYFFLLLLFFNPSITWYCRSATYHYHIFYEFIWIHNVTRLSVA